MVANCTSSCFHVVNVINISALLFPYEKMISTDGMLLRYSSGYGLRGNFQEKVPF